ncbi:DNA-packaging protein [Parabacteroides sp. BX2]|jgi:hypothetical protein|uniref:DNA-packaging protein n=1 Tax=Parabacteroides segnis TaxID=2763058 RepID=A0ABR7E2S4_9BACT|nr:MULTISPECIES: DNA-packaging protein [Parabacteroides]MBC5644055.1 DNA-packaging protein [Parabacteroides segnis]MCM0714242.1 DNA-packaging protein [Parabacteroides sp. TA-V-105]
MAASKNNQFWKLRSKHGRDTLFSSPELLWSAACEYFDWCDENPWYKKEAIKSGKKTGKCIDVPTQRPYTMTGLCCYLGCSEAYFRQFDTSKHEDFSTVISQIKQIIEVQQREGAIVGAFNANIISRMLGEVDKVDVTTGGNKLQFTGFNFLPVTPNVEQLIKQADE